MIWQIDISFDKLTTFSNYVDLSDRYIDFTENYVNLSENEVDLSNIKLTSRWHIVALFYKDKIFCY